VIVKFFNFKNSIEKYSGENLYLFYGPNFGKVEVFSKNLFFEIKKKDPNLSFLHFSTTDLTKESFLEILSKYDQVDLFGNSTALIISLDNVKLNKEIVQSLKNYKIKSLVLIFKSGPLEKKSQIRNFFEQSPDLITIPCYEESLQEKKEIISTFFKHENVEVKTEELIDLAQILGNERLEIENELEKIIVLIKNSDKGSIKSFSQMISKTAFFDDNSFLYSIVSGKKKKFLENYGKFTAFQNNEVKIISFLSEHLFKILIIKNKLANGLSFDEAIKNLRPPIFFKFKKEFDFQVRRWTESEILSTLKKLYFCQNLFINGFASAKNNLMFLMLKILVKGG